MNSPFTGVAIMIHGSTKLQLWNKKIILWDVTTTWGTGLNHHRMRKSTVNIKLFLHNYNPVEHNIKYIDITFSL